METFLSCCINKEWVYKRTMDGSGQQHTYHGLRTCSVDEGVCKGVFSVYIGPVRYRRTLRIAQRICVCF